MVKSFIIKLHKLLQYYIESQEKVGPSFCFCVVIGKLPAVTLGYHADCRVPRCYGRQFLKIVKDELSTISLLNEFH